MSIAEDEPGVPGNFDDDGKPYFFPGNQQRPADAREQRDGFVPRWKYRGHSGDNIKGIQATGRDAFGRIRFVSTDGPSIHSWLEGGDSDSVKIGSSEHMINALTFVRALNVVAAASEDRLVVFDGRTMRSVATLSTSRKVLLQLHYNQARDEIISGGSDGCFVWRLAAISCELSSLDAVLFELTLLHGFKVSSSWAGTMVWDEAAQVILTIDGTRVKTYNATTTTTTKVHTINKAHESPVTAGLWINESENIVTGCMGGYLKIWACQHTDATGAKRGRRPRWRKKNRIRSRRQGRGQQPALVESFGGHCGAITGLVRHSLNVSYVVSSGADGTLRVWDIDRLSPVTNVQLPYTMASLWAASVGGEARLLCAGTDGGIRTMVVRQVSQPLSFDTDGAQKVRYFPPLRGGAKRARIIAMDDEHDERDEEGYGTCDPEQHGLLLVQKKHGLWGLMSESFLFTTSAQRTAESAEGAAAFQAVDKSRSERGEGGTSILEEGTTTSSLFFAWPPLSCVVERYSHHVLSRRRRKVMCLADSGVLDIYQFGAVNAEARKLSSRKIDLHASGATATCMCLLPDTPTCVQATLDRLLASSSRADANLDGPASSDPDVGRGDGQVCRNEYGGGAGGKKGASRTPRETQDQVVAVGTSHGGLVVVETVVGGTTLDYLEGVFASGVLHIAFCDASTDEAIRRDEASPHTEGPAPFAKDSGRLVCAGYDANGTVTIKGLSVSSLMEKFYLRLVENPTHVRVANRRPIVAIGYADGALNAVHFGEDRVHDLDGSALVGAHTTKIHTIAFSTRHRCMASGSADGYVVIWDLNGQQLHTIYLQTPALAVEFMEVSGELLVSSSSGMSRIPLCQWCPLRLLIANEREDRRVAATSSSGSANSASPRRAPDTTTELSPVMTGEAAASEGESNPGVRIGPNPQPTVSNRRCRGAEHEERKVGGGASGILDGGRPTSWEEGKAWDSYGNGLRGTEQGISSGSPASDFGGKGDPRSAENAEREWTKPEAADVSTPLRWRKHSRPRGGGCSGAGASISPKREGHERTNILDRMNVKFSSLPMSPPPSVRAAKRRASTCLLHTTPAGSPVPARIGGEETLRQAVSGEQCARQDDQTSREPTRGAITTSPPPETERPDPGTTPIAGTTPADIERGIDDDELVETDATKETPSKREENYRRGDDGGSVVGTDLAASSSINYSTTDYTLLSGSFLDGVVPCLLNQHGAMPWRSTGCQLCTTPLDNCPNDGRFDTEVVAAEIATGNADKPSFKRRGRTVAVKATQQRRATNASSLLKPNRQKVARGRAPRLTSASVTISGQALTDKLHCSTASKKDATLFSLLSPSTPAWKPPLWDETHDVPLAISAYPSLGRRQNRLVPASTPPMLGGGGIGAGTAAAIAAKDVHNVVPPTSTSRAIMKPVVVGNLGSPISRWPLPPSPPASGAGSYRAFGVISPRLWSEGGGDCCRMSLTPRRGNGESSPWTPGSQPGEVARWGCIGGNGQHNSSVPVSRGNSTSFFPVRPRPGRSIPAPFRNQEQTAPQS